MFEVEFLFVTLIGFTILCELWPRTVSMWNSMAWAAHGRLNVGVEAFEFQCVLYELYHSTWPCRILHLTVFSDFIAWFGAAAHYGGPTGLAVLVAALALQSMTFRNTRLSLLTFAFCAAVALVAAMSPMIYHYALYIILFGGAARSVGHMFEPTPPIVFDVTPQLKFHNLPQDSASSLVLLRLILGIPQTSSNLSYCTAKDPLTFRERLYWHTAIIWSPLFGIASELQAGLPYRLVHAALYVWLTPLSTDLDPPEWETDSKKIRKISKAIAAKGWDAWGTTKAMFKGVV